MKQFHNITKKLFDVVFGVIGLVLVSPLFIIIAIVIKLDTNGDIFFKQARLGKDKKPYMIYKFRSMVENAENMGTGIFNMKNDSRVTKVGQFLRDTSIDELPQFINIINGTMSFVGPRPPVTYELGDLDELSQEFENRFRVKPGVTGLAQVSGRNELSWDEKVKFDNEYIEKFYRYGIVYDIWFILLTIVKVIKNEGSHEIEENIQKDMARIKKDKEKH
jgi:lipopolysaccharide/colanic/teichoic acid biosynthesis glycosyltransferase